MKKEKEQSCSCGCCHEHEHEHKHEHEHEHEHEDDCCKNGCCHVHEHEHEHEHGCSCCHDDDDEEEDTRVKIIRMAVTALLCVAGFVLPASAVPYSDIISPLLFFIGYLVCGYDVILRSAKRIVRGKVFDECFLMSIATIGAFLIGEYAEGAAVMLFYQLGETLQDHAAGKSRRKVRALLKIAPEKAGVLRNGEEISVAPSAIRKGDTVIVRPGERVPVDGIALSCENISLDTSAITGESIPRDTAVGDHVYSGSIVSGGVLTMTAEKEYHDSTVAKIMRLIEEASEKKSKTESFITRFSKIYTPVVVILALIIAFVPPLFGADLNDFVHRGLVFLVVSCPCALVLSVPIAYFAGIGAASSIGVLVKGGGYLDVLSRAKTAVFDKTGTLTRGVFEVTEIIPEGITKEELTRLAVHGECMSNHPIARSIEKLGKADISAVSDAREIAGNGTVCTFEGKELICGKALLLDSMGIAVPQSTDSSESSVFIAYDKKYVGRLVLSDIIKSDSREAVEALKKMGVNCIMLTGDTQKVAADTAKKLGIDEFYTELLPDGKTDMLEKIKQNSSGTVIFTGDGINDAPVIAAADAGVAMGSLGSDAAIEAADVVLMTDEPTKLAAALKTARSVRKRVVRNIIFILAVKSVILVLSVLGYDSMWLAVFADIGTALIATAYSVSILGEK